MSSQCFTLAGYVLIAVAWNVPILFISRVIAGLGGGNLGVAQSYIVDVVDEGDRPKALAWATAAFGLGFVVGPIISGLMIGLGFDAPFWGASAFEAINLVFTAIVLRDAPPHRSTGPLPRGLFAALTDRAMLNLMARQFLYIFAFTYFFTIFGFYLDRRLHVDARGASLFLGAAGAIGAATLVFAIHRLSDRFGDFRLSEAAFVAAFVTYALLGFVSTPATFLLVLVLWAASGSALRPALNKLIADAAPPHRRGAILGFADALSNASMIFAPAVGSAILEIDPRLSGVVPAICAAAGFMLGLFRTRRSRTAA
jgi:predicted MFS family arabinose efflux permease